MKNVKAQIDHLKVMSEYYAKQSDLFQKASEWFAKNGHKLEGLDVDHYGDFIHVQVPTRADLMRALKAFPGKWSKSVNDIKTDKLDYTLDGDVERPTIHCKAAPPPPSCQIVEEEVEIPAQPARRELRKVVKCVPDVEQAPDEAARCCCRLGMEIRQPKSLVSTDLQDANPRRSGDQITTKRQKEVALRKLSECFDLEAIGNETFRLFLEMEKRRKRRNRSAQKKKLS